MIYIKEIIVSFKSFKTAIGFGCIVINDEMLDESVKVIGLRVRESRLEILGESDKVRCSNSVSIRPCGDIGEMDYYISVNAKMLRDVIYAYKNTELLEPEWVSLDLDDEELSIATYGKYDTFILEQRLSYSKFQPLFRKDVTNKVDLYNDINMCDLSWTIKSLHNQIEKYAERGDGIHTATFFESDFTYVKDGENSLFLTNNLCFDQDYKLRLHKRGLSFLNRLINIFPKDYKTIPMTVANNMLCICTYIENVEIRVFIVNEDDKELPNVDPIRSSYAIAEKGLSINKAELLDIIKIIGLSTKTAKFTILENNGNYLLQTVPVDKLGKPMMVGIVKDTSICVSGVLDFSFTLEIEELSSLIILTTDNKDLDLHLYFVDGRDSKTKNIFINDDTGLWFTHTVSNVEMDFKKHTT